MDNKIIFSEDKQKETSDNTTKSNVLKYINKKTMKIIILVIIGVIGLIIYFGTSTQSKKNTEDELAINTSGYLSTLDYCKKLEEKLKDTLSNVDGAGNVKVMISVDGSPELIYATDSNSTESNNTSGTSTSSNSSSPIIVTVGGESSALILTENLPNVKGVIVVSSGADDVSVKLDIINAVSTLLDISTSQVSVLKGI